jgi:hypothetical protein
MFEYDDTHECIESTVSSFKNCYTTETILMITPKDIYESVESWSTAHTSIEDAVQGVTDWLTNFKEQHKEKLDWRLDAKNRLSSSERREILRVTVEEYRKSFLNIDGYLSGTITKKDIESLYESFVDDFLNNITSLTDRQITRFLNIIEDMGYGIIDGQTKDTQKYSPPTIIQHTYPFIYIFITQIVSLEKYIYFEINPYKNNLFHLTQVFYTAEESKKNLRDKKLIKRLEFYREIISKRNKHPYRASELSNYWKIPFDDFAKIYRLIFGLSNTSLKNL